MSIVTFKYRIKGGDRRLKRFAIACNQVWNFCVATQREAERRREAGANCRWPSAFDLIMLASGSASDLGLHSDTVQTVCRQFVKSRDQYRRSPRFRASYGAKRALGWIPIVPRAVRIDGSVVVYLKKAYRFLEKPRDRRSVQGWSIRAGCSRAVVRDVRL